MMLKFWLSQRTLKNGRKCWTDSGIEELQTQYRGLMSGTGLLKPVCEEGSVVSCSTMAFKPVEDNAGSGRTRVLSLATMSESGLSTDIPKCLEAADCEENLFLHHFWRSLQKIRDFVRNRGITVPEQLPIKWNETDLLSFNGFKGAVSTEVRHMVNIRAVHSWDIMTQMRADVYSVTCRRSLISFFIFIIRKLLSCCWWTNNN